MRGDRSAPRYAAGFLDLLLPSGCVSCGSWIPPRAGVAELVCARCRARLRPGAWPRCPRCHWPRGTGRSADAACRACAAWAPELAAARYAFELVPPADDLVHGLKYEGWRELASFMGDAVAGVERPPPVEGTAYVVVPVPTTPERLRTRGYNQAALLAERVALRTGIPLVTALRRPAARGSQTSLTPDARRENVRGAFVPSPDAAGVRGRSVLLVDDVLTTGATVSAAAVALAPAGAVRVVAVTFARAPGAHGRSRS